MIDDKRVYEAFSTNRVYYERLEKWHLAHSGAAIEPEIKKLIVENCHGNILDAGCGEGSITSFLAENYVKGNFFGIDVSQAGIAMARSRKSKASFTVGNLCELPFKDSFFELIYSQSVLEHVPDYERSLEEFYRVLKMNGKLIIRVGNGILEDRSLVQAFFASLFRINKVKTLNPSLIIEVNNLRDNDFDVNSIPKDHNFDVNSIPSDVLINQLKKRGFNIKYFTTRRNQITKDSEAYKNTNIVKRSLRNLLMRLPFPPFIHLGSTIIVMAEK